MEEEGVEDNSLEEDSRDGQVCWAWGRHTFPHPMVLVTDTPLPSQEDGAVTLQSSQDRDTMDTGVPDGTEAEDLSEPCLGEGDTNDDHVLHAFGDSKEYVAAQLGQLPAQLLEHAVGNLQPRVRQRPWGLSIRAAQVLVEPDLSLIPPQSGAGGHCSGIVQGVL